MNGENSHTLKPSLSSNNTKADLQKVKHDLSNILNNILSAVDLLSDETNKNGKSALLIKSIKKNTILASSLISSFSNTQNSYKEILSLAKVVQEAIELFQIETHQRNIIFINNAKNDCIMGNILDINRIILNLVKNSIEADGNAQITIELNNYDQDLIEISINDSGPGIHPDNLDNIFDLGFSSKKNENMDHGYGLSIVKELVHELSGSISVNSQLDKGTSFKIIFPLKKTIKHSKIFYDKTIIIGEDDPFQMEVLKDLLSSLGIKIFSASNGIEILTLLKSVKPDLIIIDKFMPVMDGIECIKNIKRNEMHFPIILTSGSDLEKIKDEINVEEILLKPYSFESVQNILERLL
ncbi:MAG: hybrid sensor histidine kinase/response regulator [Ignavibacteriae bacterium]|jgi:CheY-like chemotaxis protein|nr:hybrid sensor histidine kinase/response regulator [Ignavibacteriota bacterium]